MTVSCEAYLKNVPANLYHIDVEYMGNLILDSLHFWRIIQIKEFTIAHLL